MKNDPNIKYKGKKFSKDYQPTPKAKSDGKKRISNFKEALIFFGDKLKKKISVDGNDIELTFESNIAFELLKKANEGDLKAIELMARLSGWEAPKQIENKIELGKDVKGLFIED